MMKISIVSINPYHVCTHIPQKKPALEPGNFGAYINQEMCGKLGRCTSFLATTGSRFDAGLLGECARLQVVVLSLHYIAVDWSRLHYIRLRYIR